MPSTTPYITLNSLLNFNESSSGDVDTFTAYTDFLGQPSRALWVLNQLGTNTWTGHIESGGAGDSSDVIPFSIPTATHSAAIRSRFPTYLLIAGPCLT